MKLLTITQKRWLLILHLVFVSIWFGSTVVLLILSITAFTAAAENTVLSSYTIMHLIATTSGRASIFGTVVTGILLSVLTKWGLFKYKWIIAKEILTLISMGIGLIGIYYWTLNAFTVASAEGIEAVQSQVVNLNNNLLLVGIIFQLLSLLSMVAISIFKPWGKKKVSVND